MTARTSTWKRAASLTAATAALGISVACSNAPGAAAPQNVAGQGAAPVMVGCEPHQRALVRQVLVDGSLVSQVECVASAPQDSVPVQAYAPAPAPAARPVAVPRPAAVPVQPVAQPVYRDIPDAQIVPAAPRGARTVPARQVVYEEPRKSRSVGKSALIIGSSAAAGAGVGAAVGGKKGALIGAAAGGGGAVLWDQMTRRR